MTREMDTHLATGNRSSVAGLTPQHFGWRVVRQVGVITLNRPERKNPLTFDSYAELRDLFRTLAYADDVRAVVVQGEGGNFCSGGDVHEIIGPLIAMSMPDLLTFTRMTGDLVKAMRACPQPVIAAIDGVCAGAGAIVAMASDLRVGTARSKVAFLFTRVGLAGCDMGACSILPRIVGQGRASELLYTGRLIDGAEAHRIGLANRVLPSAEVLAAAQQTAREMAANAPIAVRAVKRALQRSEAASLEDQLQFEASEQARTFETRDAREGIAAIRERRPPRFEGR